MPGAFRSKVRDIMKQYRSGELSGPPPSSGVESPGSALPGASTFRNKFDARKYAFETAKAGLSEVPKFYEDRFKKLSERAASKPETPAPTPKPTTKPAEPAPLGDTKEDSEKKKKGGGRARNKERLARKSRRMINRGMTDVYDVQNVDPYKPPTKK